jgi:hypothetical protein
MEVPGSPLADLFLAPIPAELTYFTSLAGMEEILCSGKAPLLDARRMNGSEFVLASEIALEYLRAIPVNDAAIVSAKGSAQKMIAGVLNESLPEGDSVICYAPFYETGPAGASNARELSKESGGTERPVRIVFDPSRLGLEEQPTAAANPGANSAAAVVPCVYDRQEKHRLIQIVLDGFIEKVAQLYRRVQDQWRSKVDYQLWATVRRQSNLVFDLPTYGESIQNEFHRNRRVAAKETQRDLLWLASVFQDPTHCEEREWRLLTLGADLSAAGGELSTKALSSGPDNAMNIAKTVDLRPPGGRLAVTGIWAEPESVEEARSILEKTGYPCQLVERHG